MLFFLFVIIIAVISVIIAAATAFTAIRLHIVRKNGVETYGIVSRVREAESTNTDGCINTAYIYYVMFRTQAGETVEAKLGSAPFFTRKGDSIRIKYLPEKPKYAIPV